MTTTTFDQITAMEWCIANGWLELNLQDSTGSTTVLCDTRQLCQVIFRTGEYMSTARTWPVRLELRERDGRCTTLAGREYWPKHVAHSSAGEWERLCSQLRALLPAASETPTRSSQPEPTLAFISQDPH